MNWQRIKCYFQGHCLHYQRWDKAKCSRGGVDRSYSTNYYKCCACGQEIMQ